MLSRYLSNIWLELNDFLSTTSVHGLSYIHRSRPRTTRIIWTVLVAAALSTATLLLVETVWNWDTKYISTTVQTRGVESYPFPAVTFHPGEFQQKKEFLRTFLNHFELTRYEDSSPLFDNGVFMKKYSNIATALGPASTSLFDWVANYLLHTDKSFIQQKGGISRNEVCSMLKLKNKSERKYKIIRKQIIDEFSRNIFKYAGYRQVLGSTRKTLNSLVKDAVASENLTNTDTACNENKNEEEKEEIEALLLSFLYVFIDSANAISLGPGDIAAEEYFNRNDLHAEMTSLFNELTNASFPSSVFLFPEWFSRPRQPAIFFNPLPPTISNTELLTYQTFWKEFNNYQEKITFICTLLS